MNVKKWTIKSCILACSMALLSPSHLMADSGLVLGLGGNFSMLSSDTDTFKTVANFPFPVKYEEEKSLSGGGFSLKVGYDTYFHEQQAIRTYVDYTYQAFNGNSHPSGDIKMHSYALNLEYRFDIVTSLGVFIGPQIHYTRLEATKNSIFDHNSFGIGGNLGVVFAPLPFLELEAKFRVIGMPSQEKTITAPDIIPNPEGATHKKFELDNPMTFMIGANFKF